MRWLVLQFLEYGLVVAMFVGSAAMLAIGVVSDDSRHGLAFFLLGGLGAGAGVAALWARRVVSEGQQNPERRGES